MKLNLLILFRAQVQKEFAGNGPHGKEIRGVCKLFARYVSKPDLLVRRLVREAGLSKSSAMNLVNEWLG